MKIATTLLGINVLFLVASLSLAAQDIKYATAENVTYYSNETQVTDSYQQRRCKLDVYYPSNKKQSPVIVWYHGGGLASGNKYIPKELKKKGFVIVAPNCRLHPKVKHPTYIEDAAAALAWVFKNIERFNGDRSKIFVSGHSAGGYLASMIVLDKSYLAKHAIDANKVRGLAPFSGHTISHFTIRKEQGIAGTQAIVDQYAPLFHVRKDAPPTLLITGDRELEMLGRYEENAYMYRMMKVVGHPDVSLFELDGHNHGEMLGPSFLILQKLVTRLNNDAAKE